MTRKCFILIFSWLAFGFLECKDPYVSPYKPTTTGYLVVEGYISGNTATQFTLTRSIALPGDSTLPLVTGATVQVEGNDNSTYPLAEQSKGLYSSVDTLHLSPTAQYRLRIHTGDDDYLSDLVTYKVTPAIDSINWTNNGDGVEIYANAHDPANNTRYYLWNFDYTYEYHSAEPASVYYDGDTNPVSVLALPAADQDYRCWISASSTNLLVNSTAKLAQDVVFLQPLYHIPPDNVQLSVLFSILVRQYAITEDGYNFLSLMQKNSESLGSIFDAQPSQITGNIHSLTHPNEQVIGYVSAGTVQQQRIYISRSQVFSHYSFMCPIPDTLFGMDPASEFKYYGEGPWAPLYFGEVGTSKGWVSNYQGCIDCRLQGGTNQKPPYWPN